MNRPSHPWWLALAVTCAGCQQQTTLTALPPDAPAYLIGDTDWDKSAKAQVAFHEGVEELVAEKKPEFAPLAKISTEREVALLEQRAARLKFIYANDPARLQQKAGSQRYKNFKWIAGDEAELRKDQAYAALVERLSDIAVRINELTEWAAYEAAFKAEIATSGEYQTLKKTVDGLE